LFRRNFGISVLILHSIFISITLLLPTRSEAGKRPIALVWNGTGACEEGCANAAARVARRAGYEVKWVSEENLSTELLLKASLWVQPGGDGIEVAKILGSEGLAMIREFVSAGGSYIGFCAGAFLTDRWVDDFNTVEGLGITPVITADFAKPELGQQDAILSVNWGGSIRHIYFSEGATFKPYADRDVNVFAHYQNAGLPESPAAWENQYGAGKVVVTGVHPEATSTWKRDSKLFDQDGDDTDLALEMFERANSN
jgi:glutamine amidotransferase-like uncharacterized protein